MTRRTIPTRVVETGRLARGSSGQGVGWLQSLASRARNLRAQLVGINERLNTPFKNGFMSCVMGEQTFIANTARTLAIAQFPVRPDNIPAAANIALLVNPIFLAGETYRIPIMFTPPGVFHAQFLVVGIEAGFTTFANNARPGVTPLNDYRQQILGLEASRFGFVPPPDVGTIRYTWQRQVLGNFQTVMPFIPYFWNIIDEKSGRQYASDWMPHGALLNTRGTAGSVSNAVEGVAVSTATNHDSELFEFDTPWQFERDAQVSFLFRPIMDLYQIATEDPQLPYGDSPGEFPFIGVNDRSGGRRVQQATVRVEFHGARYYTGQDVLKDGAFLTSSDNGRDR